MVCNYKSFFKCRRRPYCSNCSTSHRPVRSTANEKQFQRRRNKLSCWERIIRNGISRIGAGVQIWRKVMSRLLQAVLEVLVVCECCHIKPCCCNNCVTFPRHPTVNQFLHAYTVHCISQRRLQSMYGVRWFFLRDINTQWFMIAKPVHSINTGTITPGKKPHVWVKPRWRENWGSTIINVVKFLILFS